jgi:hypothetical protein
MVFCFSNNINYIITNNYEEIFLFIYDFEFHNLDIRKKYIIAESTSIHAYKNLTMSK